jgi:hypothetical protein
MRQPKPTVKCPACGRATKMQEYKAGEPWTCPSCAQKFQISRTYGNIVFWGAGGLTLLFFLALGLRGIQLFVATLVMFVPILLILTFLPNRIMPLPLEAYQPKTVTEPAKHADSGTHLDIFRR